MMRFSLIFFLLSFTFTQFQGFKIGLDLNSEAEFSSNGSNMSYDVKQPISIGYEHLIIGNAGISGFGIEYLIKSDLKSISADISLLSIYALMPFVTQDEVRIFGKLGYSIPFFEMNDSDYYSDTEYDSSGGLMYGIQVVYQKFAFSHSIHNGEVDPENSGYYYYSSPTLDLTNTRSTISYIF